MFIYEFMAGVADTITGGKASEEEEEFDPHEHRIVPHPTSYGETMTHMLKCSIGAGVLAIPHAVSYVGVIFAPVGLILITIFAAYCLHMLIQGQYELCRRNKRGYMAYAKSMRTALAVGPPLLRPFAGCSYFFVNVVLMLWQIGMCAIYVVFTSENIKQVMDFYEMVASLRLHIVCLLPALIVTNICKNLKILTPFSMFSNILTFCGMTIIIFYLIEDDLIVDSELLFTQNILEVPSFIGITLFALEAVGVILALEYNMAEPKRFMGFCGLLDRGMLVVAFIYVLIGILGYLKYGNEIKASITLNLPPTQKKAQASKVLLAVALFLSFPLQNFVAYSLAMGKLRKRVHPSRLRCVDYTLRIVLVLIPWSMALAVPHLGPFIELFGALCLSLLAVVLPAVLDLCLWYPDKYGVLRWRLLRDILIIIMGMFCLSSGVYTAVVNVIKDFAH